MPSGSQRGLVSQAPRPASTRSPSRVPPPSAAVAASTRHTCTVVRSGSRWATTASRPPSGDHWTSSTSSPAGVTARASGWASRAGGRPRRGSGASMIQAWLHPRRRETKAMRRPSGAQRGRLWPAGWSATIVGRRPSRPTIQMVFSRTKASHAPSGDHCGSATACSEAVTCRAWPERRSRTKTWRAPAASAV